MSNSKEFNIISNNKQSTSPLYRLYYKGTRGPCPGPPISGSNLSHTFILKIFLTNTFLPLGEHNAQYIENIILNFFETLDRQSYDNASNISGKYFGAQSRIKEVCDLR